MMEMLLDFSIPDKINSRQDVENAIPNIWVSADLAPAVKNMQDTVTELNNVIELYKQELLEYRKMFGVLSAYKMAWLG